MLGVLLRFLLLKNSGIDRRSIGWMVPSENQDEYEGMMRGCVCEAR
jgi:hypothetical protein